MGVVIAFQRERWKMLLLEAIVWFLLHSVLSDCPPHLNSTTMYIEWTDGQQTTLEDALLSLQTPSSGRCTSLQLSTGVHYLTQGIHTLQSVVLQRHPESHNDSMPVIRCADGMRRTEDVHYDGEHLSATVSFSNVDYVEISDIIFEYCTLPLQFKAVSRLEIAHSIFRLVRSYMAMLHMHASR